eukprot:16615-Heterococcus_DN1.PRE.4
MEERSDHKQSLATCWDSNVCTAAAAAAARCAHTAYITMRYTVLLLRHCNMLHASFHTHLYTTVAGKVAVVTVPAYTCTSAQTNSIGYMQKHVYTHTNLKFIRRAHPCNRGHPHNILYPASATRHRSGQLQAPERACDNTAQQRALTAAILQCTHACIVALLYPAIDIPQLVVAAQHEQLVRVLNLVCAYISSIAQPQCRTC